MDIGESSSCWSAIRSLQQSLDQIAGKTLDCLANMQGAHGVSTLTCKIAERASRRTIEAVNR